MNRAWLGRVFLWIVAGFFAAAGVIKVADPVNFLSSILTFEVFPYRLAVVAAYWIPWLEITLALALALGFWREGAIWLTGGLLLAFIVLVLQAALRGLSIDCGCFGANELSDGWQYGRKILENSLLFGCLWVGAWLLKPRTK